jgi:hypothetical protein
MNIGIAVIGIVIILLFVVPIVIVSRKRAK